MNKELEKLLIQAETTAILGSEDHCRKLLMDLSEAAVHDAAAPSAELIELLKAIRPSYGAVGSRDIDVADQQKRIDRAIELLSNIRALARAPQTGRLNPLPTQGNRAPATSAVILAPHPVAKVTALGSFGPSLAFIANGKDFPKPGTLLYAAEEGRTAALGAGEQEREFIVYGGKRMGRKHLAELERDAARWRFIVQDGKSISGRFTLVRADDSGRVDELHGGEYDRVIDAAIHARAAAKGADGQGGAAC